ncbi:hypothetical protein BDV98DRAFT_600883 [Pterulicium gracile]|uniref:F-box domain-containing protein n=1 Tax=Pterulicium gracile TaxID=1884261 RepID=A0A5C3QTX2_9AGAR|nr:hypothetical protein BDV98DRAFT_600883 [Pterula gracilis]
MAVDLSNNNQHSLNQKPFCVCEFTSTRSLYIQDSPFKNGIFDYSQQSIAKARHVVDEGASKVDALDQVIRRLQQHRDQIHRVVLEHQAFLPPIARIPNDVLHLVFDQVVGWGWDLAEGNLWTLVSVCRRWRSLAFSQRSLWSRIALDVDHNTNNEDRALLACWRVQMQLDRLGGETLQCHLDINRIERYEHPYIRTTALRLLSSLDRCTDLDLAHITSSIADLSEELPDGPPLFPRIRNLIARRWDTYECSLESGFLSDMPALKDIVISTAYLPSLNNRIPELFGRLTSLKIHQCTTNPAEITAVLCVAAKLQRLHLHSAFPGRLYTHHDWPVTKVAELPFLDYLDAHLHPVSQFGKILPYGDPGAYDFVRQVVYNIRAPNIKDLQLNGIGREDMRALKTCLGCIDADTNSSDGAVSQVSKLTIVDPKEDSLSELSKLLDRSPALEHLQIIADNAGTTTCNIDPLLEALTWTRAEEQEELGFRRLCPQLWQMRLIRCTMSEKSLDEMMDSRLILEEGADSASHFDRPTKSLDGVDIGLPSYTD